MIMGMGILFDHKKIYLSSQLRV